MTNLSLRPAAAPTEPSPLFESLIPSMLVELPCSLVSALSAQAALRGEAVEERIANILHRSLAERRPHPEIDDAEAVVLDVERLLRDGELGGRDAR